MADEVSKSGVFIDTQTGKVVNSPPEEGTQLVAPGGTIDANAQRLIDAAKATDAASAEPVDLSAKDTAQGESGPGTVTTSTVKRK